ncbi:MAG: hypothetical protein KAT11_05375 [Phycisphaerae bacterium]|nr:hypothetical protein [Phycisphaerae bacterium]
MTYVSLIILLAGMSYLAGPRELRDRPSPRPRPIANAAQQRLYTRRQLRQQIEQWRTEAAQIKPHEIEQALKEIPNVVELEIMVGPDWDQVTTLLINEMRSRRANRWEKVYVGRRLVALLSRASRDDLARQARLLVRASLSAPDPIRALPEPSVKFPGPEQKEAVESGPDQPKQPVPSGAYLQALRQAKEDAKNRNAHDERIMLLNQSVDVLGRDFTDLLLESSDRLAYLAVIEKLSRQLRDADAAFVQTIEALEEAPLDKLDIRLARVALNKLRRLAKRFAGPRQYTVYTEVKKQLQKRSDFGQIELDFQKSIENTLSKLSERIERHRRRESFEPLERTPGPLQRTPGPTRGPSGADGG